MMLRARNEKADQEESGTGRAERKKMKSIETDLYRGAFQGWDLSL